MSNVAAAQAIYAAFAAGDMPAVLGAMHDNIRWNEAENSPYADGNPYVGPDAILSGLFERLGGEWDGFAARPDRFLDAGEHVVALGRYSGTARATGKPLDAQFAHVWRFANGKVESFQQYTDTHQHHQALTG